MMNYTMEKCTITVEYEKDGKQWVATYPNAHAQLNLEPRQEEINSLWAPHSMTIYRDEVEAEFVAQLSQNQDGKYGTIETRDTWTRKQRQLFEEGRWK